MEPIPWFTGDDSLSGAVEFDDALDLMVLERLADEG